MTFSKYEQFENDLVALFADESFEVVPLPDTEYEYNKVTARSKVFVAYESSDFSESETLSRVVQEEKMKFFFEIHSMKRRGFESTLSIFETIRKKIVGYKFLGYDKFTLVQTASLAGSGANHWVYLAYFSTVTKISDCQPEPDSTGNLLKDPDFVNP